MKFLHFIALIGMCSCENSNSNEKIVTEYPDRKIYLDKETDTSVTLILRLQKNQFFSFNYFDKFFNFYQIMKECKSGDTTVYVQIPTSDTMVLYYSVSTKIPLIARPGDSIVCAYEESLPKFRIKNISESNRILNFFSDLFAKGASVFDYELKSVRNKNINKDSLLESLYTRSVKYLEEAKSQIDSDTYNTYKALITYEFLDKKAIRFLVDNKNTDKLKDSLQYFINKDEWVNLNEYRIFCSDYLSLSGDIKKRKNAIDEYNYSNNLYTGNTKNKMLFLSLQGIRNMLPDSFPAYLKKIKQDCSDSSLLAYIKVNFEQTGSGINKMLEFPNNKPVSFTEILERNLGKPIYIDFWASWCVPCREEMPFSHELQKKYPEFAFVYISIDDVITNWQNASNKEGLSEGKQNFLLQHVAKSDLNKQFNLSTIPRYALVNKSGKFINKDAPRPSDPLLIEMFNKMLATQ